MISALHVQSNERVIAENDRDWLREQGFICPRCKYPVTAKTGEQLVWHFAHTAGSSADCPLKTSVAQEDRIKVALLNLFNKKGVGRVEVEYFPKTFSSKWPLDIVFERKEKWYAYQIIAKQTPPDKIKETLEAQKIGNLNFVFTSDFLMINALDCLQPSPKVRDVLERTSSGQLCFVDIPSKSATTVSSLRKSRTYSNWYDCEQESIPLDDIHIDPRTGHFLARSK